MTYQDEAKSVTFGILGGDLVLPNRDIFVSKFGEDVTVVTERMFNALWERYLLNKGKTNSIYWLRQFPTEAVFNSVVEFLSLNDWVISDVYPARNWADIRINENKLLQFVTTQELANTRGAKKYRKYDMANTHNNYSTLVRVNGQTKQTGLFREGFAKASGTQYYYDIAKLRQYYEPIVKNAVKGMAKVRQKYPKMATDNASYDVVAREIIDGFINDPRYYSQLGNKSDTRGRAIKDVLSKIGNPIGYKDFRSLLTIPEPVRQIADSKGCYAIYLFIAELEDYREGPSSFDKAKFGRECYQKRSLPQLDLEDEEDRKDLHKLIWLERIYAELDNYFNYVTLRKLALVLDEPAPEPFRWSVPIELDASSSMLQYEGCLLNDDRLLRMTNVIGKEITDPWHVIGLSRGHVKKACTPLLYGSNQSIVVLWQNAKLEYTRDHIKIMTKELKDGAYGFADAFKCFLIQHVTPEVSMTVHIWNDIFDIECNRFRNVGDLMNIFDIYDTKTGVERRICHMDTHKEPDLEQFRRYFVTLLIHNLDSQVADDVAGYIYDNYGFCLDIHDAFIVSPQAALATRKRYVKNLTEIRTNRKSILANYFKSVGIGSEASQAWEDLMATSVQAESNEPIRWMSLK